MSRTPPARADVVIIGGGIVGASIAYHLAQIGITNTVVLERKQLTCGTTWHAAGLVGQLRASRNLTELAKYTTDLFERLEKETGQATGFKQNGSISIALNRRPHGGTEARRLDGQEFWAGGRTSSRPRKSTSAYRITILKESLAACSCPRTARSIQSM